MPNLCLGRGGTLDDDDVGESGGRRASRCRLLRRGCADALQASTSTIRVAISGGGSARGAIALCQFSTGLDTLCAKRDRATSVAATIALTTATPRIAPPHWRRSGCETRRPLVRR